MTKGGVSEEIVGLGMPENLPHLADEEAKAPKAK